MLEHPQCGAEVTPVDELDVQSEGRRIRRQRVKNVHQDRLSEVERTTNAGPAGRRRLIDGSLRSGRGISRFATEQKPIQVRRNISSQPAQEFEITGMADRREAQKDARFESVELLDQPDDVVGVKKDLRGEESKARGALATNAIGLVEAAGDGDAAQASLGLRPAYLFGSLEHVWAWIAH